MATRKPLIVGNWKMNKTIAESLELVSALEPLLAAHGGAVDVAVAPPATALSAVSSRLSGSVVATAAQNCHAAPSGAYTGEISVAMLADAGAQWIIVGHSERRTLFAESDEAVAGKVSVILGAGLSAIVCIGENLAQREAGAALEVVSAQLEGSLKTLSEVHMRKVVVAYEPVWAIGTGKTATSAQAQEVHAYIRSVLERRFGAPVAQATRILYGGSVKPQNARELLLQPDIDGLLVGGASLVAVDFAEIATCAATIPS
jgi:triosephosphate isomerase (TIM)